mmetsp:Transcript_89616/g.159100  ORF Transcript_89616/g.159100 Transcript_89616/m.159100 type:complete len:2405 (-) Transcript_89616:69-7283(-)
MPVSLNEFEDVWNQDHRAAPWERWPTLLNDKFTVHSYDGGSQQNRPQYDVKHVLTPTLEPFHCSDRGSKFNLVLKCSEDFTLTHFYISGPGPRCTEPIRSGLVWVCETLPEGLAGSSDFDEASTSAEEEDQCLQHQENMEEGSRLPAPCLRFYTDPESRDAEIELPRWREGKYIIVRLLDTHFQEEQVNVDVGLVAMIGYWGRCAEHQVPLGPWMGRRVQQAWVHPRPLQRTFSAGGWVCDGRDFSGGCRSSFLDFHQTNVYTSRFHCSATGFDLCDACANDPGLGKLTEASIKADVEALRSPSSCKIVASRLRNLWRRHWLHPMPRYFRQGLLSSLVAGLQSCLDAAGGHAKGTSEEEGKRRNRELRGEKSTADPQHAAALRALLQLTSELVQLVLATRHCCDVQVNDLVWAHISSAQGSGTPDRWERCRVVRLPLAFSVNHPAPEDEEDEDMEGDQFVVSCRDWKCHRCVQARNIWKVTKPLNDEEVMAATTSLFGEVSKGAFCDAAEVRRLLRQSADVSATNAEGRTALLGAAQSGCSMEVFAILLEAKSCPDQADRCGATALQLYEEAAESSELRMQLWRHGATELCKAGSLTASPSEEALDFLKEELTTHLLGPLLGLHGLGGESSSPPAEALEVVQLLLRHLPQQMLSRALILQDSDPAPMAAAALGKLLQDAVQGTSGPMSALQSMRLARALKARSKEEPEMLTFILRHGVHRWAHQIAAMKDPVQGGAFGPACQHEKTVSSEELTREAKALDDELGGDMEFEIWRSHGSLAGVARSIERAITTSVASDIREAFAAVHNLLVSPRCTAYELETSNLAGHLLQLLGQDEDARNFVLFEEIFSSDCFVHLVQALKQVVSISERFPTWRHKRERGLKAITEPLQLRLQSQDGSPQGAVSVMVEPLVPLGEILRYLLRITPVANEDYLGFCHQLVGSTLRDRASGDVYQVLAFELLLTDCPLPIHTVRLKSSGETYRLLLSMRDYEYSATPDPVDDGHTSFKVALSLLHLAGGSNRYTQLLELLSQRLDVERKGDSMASEDFMSEDDNGDSSSSSSCSSSGGRRRKRTSPRSRRQRKKGGEDTRCTENLAEQHALQRAVAAACGQGAEELLEEELGRCGRASSAAILAAGEEAGQAVAIDPSLRVHSVTIGVPEEIPLEVFWPMVQEDVMSAAQDIYPRGMPPQVQEALQTGTPRDGAIPVAQRLSLEEAEMLAARLAHLAQATVAVDMGVVNEIRRLNQRMAEGQEHRDGRWLPQLARQGRQATRQGAPAVAARVRLKPGEAEDWISGVVVGHGPPDAPWRRGGDALLDVIDDQGFLWEQLPASRVKLPAVQKASGGESRGKGATRGTPTAIFGGEDFDISHPMPPPPALQPPQAAMLRQLQLPQPPPPPQAPLLLPASGVAHSEEGSVQWQAADVQARRHSRQSRSRSKSRSQSSRSRSRSRSRAAARRAAAAAAAGHAREEGRRRRKRGNSEVEAEVGTPVSLRPGQLVPVGSLQEAPILPPEAPRSTARSPIQKGALADVLRGDLPSFARAADSQDPTTLLGHPVAVRLESKDLEEEEARDEEAAKDVMAWLPSPKFQARFCLPSLKDGRGAALPADWSLLKTIQCLHDEQSSKVSGDKEISAEAEVPLRGIRGFEKVSLEGWHLGYWLEPVNAFPEPGARDALYDSLCMDPFALPPSADDFGDAATASTASEHSLSLLPPLSSSPASAWTSSPWRTPLSMPSPWCSPGPGGQKRRRRAASSTPLLQAESPSLVPRDLYSPVLQPSRPGWHSSHAGTRLRQCMAATSGPEASAADALELLCFLQHSPKGQALPASVWMLPKLDWKLGYQLEDPLSVSSGALPLWATVLPRTCPFLFSFETRKTLLRATAFGPSFALHWVQQKKLGPYLRRRTSLPTELGSSTDPRKLEELLQEVSNIEDQVVRSENWLGALQSTLLRLQRGGGNMVAGRSCEEQAADQEELLLQQAEAAMELLASSGRLLEVQFDSENGFGTAVTRSFYAEVARALQGRAANRFVPLWVEDDFGATGNHSSASSGASGHLRCRCGLLVRPLLPGPSKEREAAERRFRFLGRLVGRALKDDFIVPLPLSEAFFEQAIHRKAAPAPFAAPGGTGLPRPGAGCVGELCGALADFARELRSGEAELHAIAAEAGRRQPLPEELACWRRAQGDRKDFVERFLTGSGASAEPMSFSQYTSLVGVSFLETGLSGAPLCPGGEDIAVTVENVDHFVELATRFWLDTGIARQLEAFREGLNEVLPVECFDAFSAAELRDMICGEDTVEWGERELLDHLHPSGGLTEHSPAYQHLVAVLLDMDQGNRSRFLDFVSSCPRLPPGGIDSFHVDVFPESASGRGFPRSRACANQLYLPSYASKEELRERLHEAMHGSVGHHEQEQRIVAS